MDEIFQKNKAFTLAEVLITLGIIGIIAAMTIPTLMNKTNDAELKVAWKKAFSISSQAFATAINDNGGSLTGVLQHQDQLGTSIFNLISPYFSTIQTCTAGASKDVCLNGNFMNLSNTTPNYGSIGWPAGFILKDGSSIVFKDNTSFTNCNWNIGSNGLQVCGYAIVDVNGPKKKPNKIGKDMFYFWVLKDRILPEGNTLDGRATDPTFICDSTSTTTTGSACSSFYLYN